MAAVGLVLLAGPAWGHGLVQRYVLPLPLWLYLAGAGAVVALSFVMVGLLARGKLPRPGDLRIDLAASGGLAAWAGPALLLAGRALSIGLLVLVVLAGLAGRQSPFHNIAPVLVWVIWWVGVGFVSALTGDVWAWLNPWRILAAWAQAARAELWPGRRPRRPREWPSALGVWPAVILFLAFAWMELVWVGRDRPRSLALAIIAYSVLTWLGMLVFGREPWVRGADPFAAVFGLLARLSPTEIRLAGRGACRGCSNPVCREPSGSCTGCLECYARARPAERRLSLRPPGAGLLVERPISPSMLALVLLMLGTVTFDGLTETPAWAAIEAAIVGLVAPPAFAFDAPDPGARRLALTLGLLATPLAGAAIYAAFARLMLAAAGSPGAGRAGPLPAVVAMRWFALTLLPIAFAYHVAHYLPFLLLAGQLVIPLASDPFGLGWDLFGTALYRIDIAILSAGSIWYTALAVIVAGHVLAVYLAHLTALRVFGAGRRALRSQYPMLALMVAYTMLSLWILAQPVVTDR